MEGILILKELADAEVPNINAAFLLAQFSVTSGQLDKAVERYTQVLELDPNHIDATWELAMLNMKMGDLEAAVSRFEDCVDKDETLSNGYFFMAQCYDAMGRKEKPLKHLRLICPLLLTQ